MRFLQFELSEEDMLGYTFWHPSYRVKRNNLYDYDGNRFFDVIKCKQYEKKMYSFSKGSSDEMFVRAVSYYGYTIMASYGEWVNVFDRSGELLGSGKYHRHPMANLFFILSKMGTKMNSESKL